MLPVLGFDFLKPKPAVRSTSETVTSDASPIFEYASGEAYAKAQEIDGEFVVLCGSTALKTPKKSDSYKNLREQLIRDGKLVEVPNQPILQFTTDVVFNSPSAGAAVVNAGNMNGRTAWKVVSTKQTYADWHQSQLPDMAEDADD